MIGYAEIGELSICIIGQFCLSKLLVCFYVINYYIDLPITLLSIVSICYCRCFVVCRYTA